MGKVAVSLPGEGFPGGRPGSRKGVAFPQRALGLAATRRLGEPIRAFDARPGFRRAVAWLVMLGLASILLVWSAVYYLREGPVWLGVLGAVLAAGYLGGVGWIVRAGAVRGRGVVVYLFEDGLVRLSAGGADTAVRWDELRTVTMSGRRSAPGRPILWRFTLTGPPDRRMVLGHELPDVGRLGETAVREITRRMVPRYLREIEEGGTVRLGPYSVGRAGVQKDGETVPWESVRDAGTDNGMVYVRRAGGSTALSATVGRVPNALALAVLCKRLRAAEESGTDAAELDRQG